MVTIEQECWALTPEGEAVVRYRMRNSCGAEVELSNLGAAVTAIRLPNPEGGKCDVLLGYGDPLDYRSGCDRLGLTIGRYAGRIGRSSFLLDGEEIRLEANAGRHHLDGGAQGLGSQLWESRVEENRVVMELASPDGSDGWPGNLYVQVIFDFDDENSIEITYRAAADRTTCLNLSSALFLNLDGEESGSVLEHELQVNSHQCVVLNGKLLPTGELAEVADTPLDFRLFRPLKEGIEAEFNQMEQLDGYDHHLLVEGWQRHILGKVATLRSPRSGRRVEILSSYPALRLYTGNCLSDGSPRSKSERRYNDYDGLLLAPMYLPDSPNHPEFPTTRIEAGELYCEKTVYRFFNE